MCACTYITIAFACVYDVHVVIIIKKKEEEEKHAKSTSNWLALIGI